MNLPLKLIRKRRIPKQPENNDDSKQWMERIFKRHKKLKIDFYLYDSFFFCFFDWATTAVRRESHEIHFHFETAKQMFIIAGKYHSASGATTTTQKSFFLNRNEILFIIDFRDFLFVPLTQL